MIVKKKNGMIQVASCEQTLIKTNRKPIQNHQSKTMLLFKMYTLEFKFDRHLEHMGSYQGMQSRLPLFLVAEFGAIEILMQNDWENLIVHISPTGKIENRSYLNRK